LNSVVVKIGDFHIQQKAVSPARTISGGALSFADQLVEDRIELPFEHSGTIVFFIKYADDTIAIHGSGIWIDAVANPHFDVHKRSVNA
jgi:hypothetical protein